MYRASGVDTDALKACVIAWCFVYESMGLGAYIPELDKLHVPIDLFYYKLACLLYDFLGEGDYFDEDD